MERKSIGKTAAWLSVLVVLSGCATGPRQATQTERDISDARNEYAKSVRLVNQFKAQGTKDCQSPIINKAKLNADMVSARTIKYYRGLRDDYNFSDLQKTAFFRTIGTLNPMAIDASFNIADAFLSANCLDQADNIYRDILNTYTGDSFASARERAKVGIDDVRAKREKL